MGIQFDVFQESIFGGSGGLRSGALPSVPNRCCRSFLGTDSIMAGDWLKTRLNLKEDPAVIGMAERLGCSRPDVVGGLVVFWSWCNEHISDGNASVTPTYIDTLTERVGFANAMAEQGWLTIDPNGEKHHIQIPNWDRHNSDCAKKRALTQSRVASHRDRRRNASVTQPLRSERNTSVTREEKRREESKTPIVPRKKKTEYEQIVYDIFAAYPRPVGKALGLRAIAKAFKGGVLPGTLLAHVQAYARSVAGKIADGDMEFIPHCATWMHGKRWEDKTPQTASDLFDEQFKKTTEEQAT